ncbi:3153_t:CDS:10 [Entrophospora sp. SA101]|nr:3153_t:CDS:10 [Entrophospora sp. SA101]
MVKWCVSIEKTSPPSVDDIESDQIEEEAVDSSVEIVSSAVNDLSLSESDPLLYGTPNKRGQISLNHLLNFTFPPRQSFNHTPRRQRVTNYQPYNKERFVNANFRFIIKPTGDYTVYLVDPVQVIITTHSTPSCPICLQQPTAPRVTKCDLKSVRFWTVRTISKVGYAGLIEGEETINMRLIQRQMNSTIALPRSRNWLFKNYDSSNHNTIINTNISAPWHFTPNALVFSKLMLASFDYMQEEFNRDLKELDVTLNEAKILSYHDEIPFLEIAIVNTQDQLALLQESYSTVHLLEVEQQAIEMFNKSKLLDLITTATTVPETDQKSSPIVNSQDFQNSENEVNISTSSPSSSSWLPNTFKDTPQTQPPPSTPTSTKLDYKLKSKSTTNSQQPIISSDSAYYFYQSEDGQNVYLHPLDIRILKYEFGTYEQFPNEISFRVISVDESTMTEVDLKGVVSDSTLKIFSNELQQRLNRRKEKARKEKRLQDQAANKESKQEIIDSDPFFQQPSYSYGVWGTPAITFAGIAGGRHSSAEEENHEVEENNWDFHEEEVFFGKKNKKKKLILMSTSGRRQQEDISSPSNLSSSIALTTFSSNLLIDILSPHNPTLDQSIDSILNVDDDSSPEHMMTTPVRPPSALLLIRQKDYDNDPTSQQSTSIDSLFEPSPQDLILDPTSTQYPTSYRPQMIRTGSAGITYPSSTRDLTNSNNIFSKNSNNNPFSNMPPSAKLTPQKNPASTSADQQYIFNEFDISHMPRIISPTTKSKKSNKDKVKQKKLYQLWPGRNRFFLGGRIMTSRHSFAFTTAVLTLVIPSGLFLGFTMLRTSWSDPGIIPRNLDPLPSTEALGNTNNAAYNSNNYVSLPKEIRVNGQVIRSKYCETCKIYRPPRSSHCRQCDNSFFLMWSVGGLTCYHTYLISKNLTTHEQIRAPAARRNGAKNPFSYKNTFVNCLWVLCRPLTRRRAYVDIENLNLGDGRSDGGLRRDVYSNEQQQLSQKIQETQVKITQETQVTITHETQITDAENNSEPNETFIKGTVQTHQQL